MKSAESVAESIEADKTLRNSPQESRLFLTLILYGLWAVLSVLVLHSSGASLWFGLATTAGAVAPQALIGIHALASNPLPPRPRRPRLETVRLRDVGPEPASTVLEPSTRCTICGRPLTNLQSQYARVGSTCIQTYGPRYKQIPNPAHLRWMQETTRAQIEFTAAREAAKARFESEMETYSADFTAWQARLQEPEVATTVRHRTRAKIHLIHAAGGAALSGSAFLSASLHML